MHAKVWFDGSYNWARKIATGGCVMELGKLKMTLTETWNFGATSMNGCEFLALIGAIKLARASGATSLEILGDSNLVVNVVNGRWKAKAPHVRTWRDSCKALLATVPHTLRWIPREQNRADEFSRPLSKGVALPTGVT